MNTASATPTSPIEKFNKKGKSKPTLVPLLPGSTMWRDFGSLMFQVMLQEAFTLQGGHPMIDRAVSVDKKYKYDPIGRAENSVKYLWPVVYAKPKKAIEMGENVREMHRKIKGINQKGEKYWALDPEAYSWVHMTGFDATVRGYEIFGEPRTKEERAQMFEEWKTFGRLLGVAEKYIPDTEEQYWEYFNYMIDHRLKRGEVLEEMTDPKVLAEFPRPEEMSHIPMFVWKRLVLLISKIQHIIVVSTLPERAKQKLGLTQSKFDKVMFKLFVKGFRFVYPRLPESKQYIPLAYRAILDARRHPEEYQWPQSNSETSSDMSEDYDMSGAVKC